MATVQLLASDNLALDLGYDGSLESIGFSLEEELNSLLKELTNSSETASTEFEIPIFIDNSNPEYEVNNNPVSTYFQEASDRLGFLNQAVSPLASTLELDLLESIEDIFSSDLLAEFNQPDLGSEASGITASFGGLYDDPIEFGTPLTDAYYWRQQQGAMSCAVVAQICVYQSLTGYYIPEADASYFAQQQGWFDPVTGTPQQYVGNILDSLGIPTYETSYATIWDLQYALANGDKPIVGLDGNEIWNPQYDWYGNPLEQTNAGHAVWVTGIDYEWNGSIGIILNDSGTPFGQASVVSYSDFMNAWQDYGYFVSIADNPFT